MCQDEEGKRKWKRPTRESHTKWPGTRKVREEGSKGLEPEPKEIEGGSEEEMHKKEKEAGGE